MGEACKFLAMSTNRGGTRSQDYKTGFCVCFTESFLEYKGHLKHFKRFGPPHPRGPL